MDYFDDITFISGDTNPDCVAVVDRAMPDFYVLNYLAGGQILFGMNGGRQVVLSAPTAYWTWTENTYQYAKVPGTRWVQMWASFNGPRVQRMLERGLFKIRPDPFANVTNAPLFESRMRSLVRLVRGNDIAAQPDRTLLLEQLLSQVDADLRSAKLGDESHRPYCRGIRELAITIKNRPFEDYSFRDLSRQMAISYSYFRKLFRQINNESPHDYLLRCRIYHAAYLMEEKRLRIKEICATLRFDNPSYFSRLFKKIMGLSPRQYLQSLIYRS